MEKMRQRFMPEYQENVAFQRQSQDAKPKKYRTRRSRSKSDDDDDEARIGHVEGVKIGQVFEKRKDLSDAGVHTPLYAGISGNSKHGAFSIVVSGKYEDDIDEGDTIYYTGAGGRVDSFGNSGPQTEDQSFEHLQNKWLLMSWELGTSVRVSRGSGGHSKYAPTTGYRYDGLYDVVDREHIKGKSGFKICRFTLKRHVEADRISRSGEYRRPS
ncbi:hypothetical protein D9758_006159 [Tetrapyrgos nigripes]|uniref:YDG domain-containing protein n=1 Tax=Tetrapyrgos nigripes TaxID=182062 RepID=A0A8H5GAS2_9AGAR|nr:hypothetical protein D9758_006159 [Tetrapyrgos nigripes]